MGSHWTLDRRTARRIRLLMTVLLVTVSLSWVTQQSARSATPITVKASADAHTSAGAPNRNFGSAPNLDLLKSSPAKKGYLRFVVPSLAGPVQSASLRILPQGSGPGFQVRTAEPSGWEEQAITWNNAPSPTAYAGGSGQVKAGVWAAIDITGYVTGPGPLELILTSNSTNPVPYASREAGAASAPELLITVGTSSTTTTTAPATTGAPVLVAVGDIACSPEDAGFNGGQGTSTRCRQKATSDAALAVDPDVVAVLGDAQYPAGYLSDYMTSYDPSWGRLRSKSKPAIGNHEYQQDPTGAGHWDYFGTAAGPRGKGWYSYELGQWHVVVLNSNCAEVGGCGVGSPQHDWLLADLAANPAECTLAYWHAPRFSSGNHGASPNVGAFWKALYEAGAEVVLSGHEHDYERFAPQSPTGAADPARGIRQFVAGMGGKDHYPFTTAQPNSERRITGTFGVLKLTLRAGGYDWDFVPEAGKTIAESGSGTCH